MSTNAPSNSPRLWMALAVLGALTASPAAHAYKLLDGKWETANGPIRYTVSATGSDDLADTSETTAVDRAFTAWECVLCADVQFRNMGDGPNQVATDNINAVFWLEDATSWQQQTGAGVGATLGVTIHFDMVSFNEADIAFNGAGHTWSTDDGFSATDVESVALHEIGHFAGLDHPCTDANETDCLGPDQAVMTPAYPGGDMRTPKQDDRDGLCANYGKPKDACQAGQRLLEPCERDCDCEPNLICAPDGAGGRMCSRACGTDKPACPTGTGCVLGAGGGGELGVCQNNPSGTMRSDGSLCVRNQECQSGRCERAPSLNKLVCFHACGGDGDCGAGYSCVDGTCLLPSVTAGVPCPGADDDDPRGCPACSLAGPDLPLVGVLVLAWRRRVRQHRSNDV